MNPAILFLLISASSEVYGRERDNRNQPDPPDTFRERIGKAWNEQDKRDHLGQQPKIFRDREVRPVGRRDGKTTERSRKEEMDKDKGGHLEQQPKIFRDREVRPVGRHNGKEPGRGGKERKEQDKMEQDKRDHVEQQSKIFTDRETRPVGRHNGKEPGRGGKERKEQDKRDQMEQPKNLDGQETTTSKATTKSSEVRVIGATPSEPSDRDNRRVGRQSGNEYEIDSKDPDRRQIEEDITRMEEEILRIEKDINDTMDTWKEAQEQVDENGNATERLGKKLIELADAISTAMDTSTNLTTEMNQATQDKTKWSTRRNQIVREHYKNIFGWEHFIKKYPKWEDTLEDLQTQINNGQTDVDRDEMDKMKKEYEHLKLLRNLSTQIDQAARKEQDTGGMIQIEAAKVEEAANREENVTTELAIYSKKLNVSQLAAEEAYVKLTQMRANCTSVEEEKRQLEEQLRLVIAESEKTEMPHTTTTMTKDEDAKKEEPFVGSPLFWCLIIFGCLTLVAVIGGGIYFFFFHGANKNKAKSARKTKKDSQPKKVVKETKPAEPENRNQGPTVVDPMMTTGNDGGDNQMDTTGRTGTQLDTAFGETGPMTTTSDEANQTDTDSEGSSLLDSTGPTNLFGSREGWTGRGGIPL